MDFITLHLIVLTVFVSAYKRLHTDGEFCQIGVFNMLKYKYSKKYAVSSLFAKICSTTSYKEIIT
jgi:hypothetical protein